MSSCTNSSNIQSNLITQVIREESSGKRVVFTISSADAGISSGVTLGSVIRYDAPTNTYIPSIADTPPSSEVIGIVESIKISGATPVYTIVASGLIKYPNIESVINAYGPAGLGMNDNGTGGDAGGNDIFFLSDYAYGKLQLLEPTEQGHIVKPVMQRLAVGEYNAMVLNYIGYEVSYAASANLDAAMAPGNIVYVDENITSNIEGFIDVSTEQLLNVNDFSDLYGIFKTDYGYYQETITLKSPVTANLSLLVNNTAIQRDPSGNVINSGIIVSASTAANTITINKQCTQAKTDLTKSIVIGNQVTQTTLIPLSSKVTSFTVPSVAKQTISYSASCGSRNVQQKPLMRAKKDLTIVSIPDTVELTSLICDSIKTQGVTVGDKLLSLETRLQAVERRLGL